MTSKRKIFFALFVFPASLVFTLFAQGTYSPLTIQGLDQRLLPDVRSRGMGGTIVASGFNASVLFVNPAGLVQLDNMELRFGGFGTSIKQSQTQKWVPNRIYTGLSLMMEDLWGDIKPPMVNDSTPVADQWEQLQKPFDAIGPNWSRSAQQTYPLSVVAALPIAVSDIKFVFGIGGSQAIDLNTYFQNNNVTDPLLGQYRPQPIQELQPSDTLRARWYQFTRKREGTIWGITPAFGVLFAGVSLGASATYYIGTSDDMEQRIDRGFLTFLYNRFKVQDTVKYSSTSSGTSSYSGVGATIGLRVEHPKYAIAATVQLPYTMQRDFSRTFHSQEDVVILNKKYHPSRTTDSVRTTVINISESGSEKIKFPLAYSFGVLLTPFSKWFIAFDYEARNLNKVEHTLANGSISQPWVGVGSFRIGAEYQWNDWLAFRGGYREVPQSFSPEGVAIIGDPAMMSVYSLGSGLQLFGVGIDFAYEFSDLEYQDMWQSNVNKNIFYQHQFLLEFGYTF